MQFYAFGINHHRASVDLRDCFSLCDSVLRSLYKRLRLSGGSEYIVVSTCNRLECYLYGEDADIQRIQGAFGEEAGAPWPVREAFILKDEDAVLHILEVTSGIDSMVVGDAQILGQVKEAYRLAVEEDVVGAVLHRLMHTAFSVAKRILSETHLSTGSSSIAGTAASFACQQLTARGQDQHLGQILVVGAGEMGRLVVDALNRVPCLGIAVTNRNPERLHTMRERYPQLSTVAWENRYLAILDADVTIVTTAADHPVITAEEVVCEATSHDRILVDISVPRNVDPQIETLQGYQVHNIDALQKVIDRVIFLRKADIPRAKHICREMLSDFVSWVFHHQALQPAIQAIADTFETIRRQEIERHHTRFEGSDFAQLDRLTKSIMQKVLAVPVVRLKNVGPHHIDYVNGIKLLETLFARPSCEDDPVMSDYERTKSIIEVMYDPAGASLSALASCPFNEKKAPAPVHPSRRAVVMNKEHELVIGTRGSALALWQAEYVREALERMGFRVRLERITTRGDQILDRPFAQIEGKSLFTKELDTALLDGRIDLAVHSLKDLPTALPDGLVLAATPQRASPFDAFVAHPAFEGTLEDLPEGARIGTSSLRRTAQLLAWRPDLEIVPVRGNVDTRLEKLDASSWQGIVLAAAGLIRLGLEHRIHTTLTPDRVVPAPGQGALGIVCLASNESLVEFLGAHFHDRKVGLAVTSERSFMGALDGGCQVPVGAFAAQREDLDWVLTGFVGAVSGQRTLRDTFVFSGDHPREAGLALAERMKERGALELLEMQRKKQENLSRSVS